MITKSKTSNIQQRNIFGLAHKIQPPTPTSYKQALQHPKWKCSMHDEFQALLSQNTWTLVPAHTFHEVLGSKWMFKLKILSNGTIA